MKFFFIVLTTIFLTACGSTENTVATGPGGTPVVPPDNTPHGYVAGFTVLANYGQSHNATIRQVCNFGLNDLRDDGIIARTGSAAGEQVKVGCTPARNYTLEITNTGAVPLHFNVSIDGTYRPEFDRVVSPGEVYTFQRGF